MTLENLKRNSVDAAIAAAIEAHKNGEWSPEMAEALIMLQDSPEEMTARLKKEIEKGTLPPK